MGLEHLNEKLFRSSFETARYTIIYLERIKISDSCSVSMNVYYSDYYE